MVTTLIPLPIVVPLLVAAFLRRLVNGLDDGLPILWQSQPRQPLWV